MALSERVKRQLRCPACGAAFVEEKEQLRCSNPICAASYRVVDGVPVLFPPGTVFDRNVQAEKRVSFRKRGSIGALLSRLLPQIGNNLHARRNLQAFVESLRNTTPNPVVLIIGGAQRGRGVEPLDHPSLECVDADIDFTPITKVLLDAHKLPFADASVDGVVAQAVLEHVIDPFVCVEEIYRVLKPSGLVYAEVPFMQQVHGRGYDFHRFTRLGLLHLFKKFQPDATGACCGPGMALAWSIQYLLLSFAAGRMMRSAIRGLCRVSLFWLKYLDYYLLSRNASLDAASCYFFLGKKSDQLLDDHQLIECYVGAER